MNHLRLALRATPYAPRQPRSRRHRKTQAAVRGPIDLCPTYPNSLQARPNLPFRNGRGKLDDRAVRGCSSPARSQPVYRDFHPRRRRSITRRIYKWPALSILLDGTAVSLPSYNPSKRSHRDPFLSRHSPFPAPFHTLFPFFFDGIQPRVVY